MAAAKVSSVFRPQLFAGKSAIVTGGGTGIGKAIATELLYLGCNVLIASRKVERLKEAVLEMRQSIPEHSKARLEFTRCNIRDETEVRKMMELALDVFGRIDFLVNNAGGQFISHAEAITLKGWRAVIETNLTGTFLCCREAYNQWMKNNGGAIVTITADMWKGMPMMSHSGAARSGVDNLTKSLAIEWAPSGVRVNTVAPGSSIFSKSAEKNYGIPDIFHFQIPNIPAKRLGTVEEVSAAVMFLLSPAAAFISGEAIKVDGAHSLYAPSTSSEIPDHENLPAYSWESDMTELQEKMKSKL